MKLSRNPLHLNATEHIVGVSCTGLHFSRYCLLFALAWALLSFAVFSPALVMQMNQTETIFSEATWQSHTWRVRGNPESFSSCNDGICLTSISENRARAILDIPLSDEMRTAYNHVVFELSVTRLSDKAFVFHKGPPATITGYMRNNHGKQSSRIRPAVILQDDAEHASYQTLTPLSGSATEIRLIMNIRRGGAWQIDSFRLTLVSMGIPYRVLHGLVLAGWLAGLLILVNTLAVRSLSTVTAWQRGMIIAGVLLFVALTIVSIGNFQINVVSVVRIAGERFVGLFSPDAGRFPPDFEWILHTASHAVLTIYLYLFRRRLQIDDVGIVAINAAIAIGVECSQLGIPGRSGSMSDLVAGLGGWLLVYFLYKGIILARRRLF